MSKSILKNISLSLAVIAFLLCITQSAFAEQISGTIQFYESRNNQFNDLHVALIGDTKWRHKVVDIQLDGQYFFTDIPSGHYRIKPIRPGYRFSPPLAEVTTESELTLVHFEEYKLKGDLNCDDKITLNDLFLFLELYYNPPTTILGFRECDTDGADMNSDNVINVDDGYAFIEALINSREFEHYSRYSN